jgi:hypothetical protein
VDDLVRSGAAPDDRLDREHRHHTAEEAGAEVDQQVGEAHQRTGVRADKQRGRDQHDGDQRRHVPPVLPEPS